MPPRPNLRDPVQFLAFGFGSGLAPKAPGTFGTLAAVPVYLALSQLPPLGYTLAVVVVIAAGIWICGRASARLGVHDHPGIVWDEFAGLFVTLWMVPQGWAWIALGFVYFRVFDILKPWPIRWLDRRVGGGFGIMVDDVVAGIFAWVCLYLTGQLL